MIIIQRDASGISLNAGYRDTLMDGDEILKFTSEQEARSFLERHHFLEDEMEFLYFVEE